MASLSGFTGSPAGMLSFGMQQRNKACRNGVPPALACKRLVYRHEKHCCRGAQRKVAFCTVKGNDWLGERYAFAWPTVTFRHEGCFGGISLI